VKQRADEFGGGGWRTKGFEKGGEDLEFDDEV
jgi:hypothetical protein